MLDFLRRNKYILFTILGIISFALFVPTLITNINSLDDAHDDYKTYLLIQVVMLSCSMLAAIVFVIQGSKKYLDKTLIMCAILLYYSADSARMIYNFLKYDSYSEIFYLAINISIIIVSILALSNYKYFFSAAIILLIDAAFSLVNAFAGSAVSLGTLLLAIMIIGAIYFYSNTSNYDGDYYN